MTKHCPVAVAIFLSCGLSPDWLPAELPVPVHLQIRNQIKEQVTAGASPFRIVIGQTFLQRPEQLQQFYLRRAYDPAWIGDAGPLAQAHALLNEIRRAYKHGLDPAAYHLPLIEARMKEGESEPARSGTFSPRELASLDVLLTDAFFLYGSHLLAGRADQKAIDREWHGLRPQVDLTTLLEHALEFDHIDSTLDRLGPRYLGYDRLVQAMARYLRLSALDEWPAIPQGPILRKGDRDPRVLNLRRRLLTFGDLGPAEDSGLDTFDEALEQALKRFQQRHGLNRDGTLSTETLAGLNVPVEARVRQIAVNLERRRWLPRELGARYVLVNIANFQLAVIENNQPVLTMRVVVGKPAWRTPSFAANLTYLVLNPSWYIPPRIVAEEVLPQLRADPGYLARRNIKVYERGGDQLVEIDPTTIAWTQVEAEDFPYILRQEPGPFNPLGRVKFLFPNKHRICLHDTPARELFLQTKRKFSHGCIRIERPIEFAHYVLQDHDKWTREAILAAIETGGARTLRLRQPIPIYLVYWTAWVARDGTVQFRHDFYEYDRPLASALGWASSSQPHPSESPHTH